MTNEIRPTMRVACVRVFDCSDCHKWLVSTLIEKRTLRGHSGQSTDRSAAGGGNALAGGRFGRVCFVKAIAVGCPAAINFPLQPNGPCFVRSVRAVSVSR